MQSQETSSASIDRRKKTYRSMALRGLVDTLISEGWVIRARSKELPLVLTRGRGTATVKPSGIVVYGTMSEEEFMNLETTHV